MGMGLGDSIFGDKWISVSYSPKGPAMVYCGSSWRVGPRAARSWCLGNSEDRELNP